MTQKQTSNEVDISVNKLFKWNLIMGFLHLGQGILMLFLSKERLTQIFLYLPKPEINSRSFTLVPEKWYQVNLAYVISSFLLLSAIAHFLTITPGIYSWYLKNLKREINLIRWFEYALSSTVMIYVIANLCGINDGLQLLSICALNACMNLFGAAMEIRNSHLKQTATETNSYKTDWSNFIYGSFAGIIPWVVMSVYFFTSLDRLGSLEALPQDVKNVLKTVKFIFPILFIFFNCFAINMVLQYKQLGWWKNYLFGEKTYIILSLLAKSFLAWFIWGGTLRP